MCPHIELYAIFSCERDARPQTISLREEVFPEGGCDSTRHPVRRKEDGYYQPVHHVLPFFRRHAQEIWLFTRHYQRNTPHLRDKGILAEYIKKMEGEIMDIMSYMFDQDNVTRLYGIEQMRIGREEGKKERRREGRMERRGERKQQQLIFLR